MTIKELIEFAKTFTITDEHIKKIEERLQDNKPHAVTLEFLNRTYGI